MINIFHFSHLSGKNKQISRYFVQARSRWTPEKRSNDDDKAGRSLTMEVKKSGQVLNDGAASPSMKVGLRIGVGDIDDGPSPVVKEGIGKPALLTRAQLHELQLQTLIFKYIAAGLPVPQGFVLSIWKSVAGSSASAIAAFHRQFPSFVEFSPQEFDYRNLMDPEPGRCKRTDGKKWRCNKNVVPDHKYCERHMHRGCQRSRKHVEASQTSASSDDRASTICSSKNSKNSMTNYSNLTTVRSQMKTKSLSNASTSAGTASGNVDVENTGTTRSTTGNAKHKSTTTSTSTSATIGHKTTCMMTMASHVHESTTSGTTTIDNYKNGNIDINRQNIDGGNSHCIISAGDKNVINRSNSRRNIKSVGSSISQALQFSPKSVLQALKASPLSSVQGCSASRPYKCDLELEPGRCRRTDGKKWRCRRDVVTNEKYCGMHMHRGAKKHAEASQPAIFPKATLEVSMCTYPHPMMTLPNKADCVKLNTNFSISIPESPHVMTKDDARTTSSSSDATISDTITGTYHNKNFC